MANGNGNGWKVWAAIFVVFSLGITLGGAALDGKASRDSVCAIEKQVDATQKELGEVRTAAGKRDEETLSMLHQIASNQRVIASNQRIIARDLGIDLGE